jgi:hypothetical protein
VGPRAIAAAINDKVVNDKKPRWQSFSDRIARQEEGTQLAQMRPSSFV